MATAPKTPAPEIVEKNILQVVKEKPNAQPIEVIKTTASRFHITSIAIREALWHLISQGELSLSEDQSLTISGEDKK